MNKYIHMLDENGVRITSIVCDNTITEEQFLLKAKELYPNAKDYICGDDNSLDEFLNGKAYVNGAFIDIPVTEYIPTKAEQIASIKKYYDSRFETLEQMVLRRRLINGDISDLQDQYKKLNMEMLAKIKAVK